MLRKTTFAGALILAGMGGLAAAQEARSALGEIAAMKAIAGCEAYAKRNGLAVSIAVLDQGGGLKAFLKMDGAALGTVEMAQWKARSAAAFQTPTSGFASAASAVPGLTDAPGIAAVGGGEPIFTADGTAPLGAVGVSGAPSEAGDGACARAAIAAAGLRATRASQ